MTATNRDIALILSVDDKGSPVIKKVVAFAKQELASLGQVAQNTAQQVNQGVAPINQYSSAVDAAGKRLVSTLPAFTSTSERIKTLGSGISKFGRDMTIGMSVLAGAIIVSTKSMISWGDSLHDMSQKTGVAVEILSQFKLSAEKSGASLGDVSFALRYLSKDIISAIKGTKSSIEMFKQLGVETKTTSGKMRDVNDVFYDVADALAAMDDGSEKITLAMQIFGRSGMNLIPMLNLGRDGLKENAEMAKKLGMIMSSETAAAADKFSDSLSELKGAANSTFQTIANTVLPTLTKLVGSIKSIVGKLQELTGNSSGVVAMFLKVAAVGVTLATIFAPVILVVGKLVGAYGMLGLAITKVIAHNTDLFNKIKNVGKVLNEETGQMVRASNTGNTFAVATEKATTSQKAFAAAAAFTAGYAIGNLIRSLLEAIGVLDDFDKFSTKAFEIGLAGGPVGYAAQLDMCAAAADRASVSTKKLGNIKLDVVTFAAKQTKEEVHSIADAMGTLAKKYIETGDTGDTVLNSMIRKFITTQLTLQGVNVEGKSFGQVLKDIGGPGSAQLELVLEKLRELEPGFIKAKMGATEFFNAMTTGAKAIATQGGFAPASKAVLEQQIKDFRDNIELIKKTGTDKDVFALLGTQIDDFIKTSAPLLKFFNIVTPEFAKFGVAAGNAITEWASSAGLVSKADLFKEFEKVTVSLKKAKDAGIDSSNVFKLMGTAIVSVGDRAILLAEMMGTKIPAAFKSAYDSAKSWSTALEVASSFKVKNISEIESSVTGVGVALSNAAKKGVGFEQFVKQNSTSLITWYEELKKLGLKWEELPIQIQAVILASKQLNIDQTLGIKNEEETARSIQSTSEALSRMRVQLAAGVITQQRANEILVQYQEALIKDKEAQTGATKADYDRLAVLKLIADGWSTAKEAARSYQIITSVAGKFDVKNIADFNAQIIGVENSIKEAAKRGVDLNGFLKQNAIELASFGDEFEKAAKKLGLWSQIPAFFKNLLAQIKLVSRGTKEFGEAVGFVAKQKIEDRLLDILDAFANLNFQPTTESIITMGQEFITLDAQLNHISTKKAADEFIKLYNSYAEMVKKISGGSIILPPLNAEGLLDGVDAAASRVAQRFETAFGIIGASFAGLTDMFGQDAANIRSTIKDTMTVVQKAAIETEAANKEMFASLMQGLSQAASAIAEYAKNNKGKMTLGGAVDAMSGAAGMIGSAVGGLVSGKKENYSGSGSSIGGALGSLTEIPGLGAIGSLVGGLFGALFGKKKTEEQRLAEQFANQVEEAKNAMSEFGKISDETANAIAEDRKLMSGAAAEAKNFAAVISDVGVTQENVNGLWTRAAGIMDSYASGELTMKEATDAASDSFSQLLEGAQTFGTEGSAAMVEFIKQTQASGLAVQEVTDYIQAQWGITTASTMTAAEGLQAMAARGLSAIMDLSAAETTIVQSKLDELKAAGLDTLPVYKQLEAELATLAAGGVLLKGSIAGTVDIAKLLKEQELSAIEAEMKRLEEHGKKYTSAWDKLNKDHSKLKDEMDKESKLIRITDPVIPLPEVDMEKLRKETKRIEEQFVDTFNAMKASGASLPDIFTALGPAIDTLSARYKLTGDTASGAIADMLHIRDVTVANQDLFDAISGNLAVLNALGNTGTLTQKSFSNAALGAQDYYKQLMTAGLTGNQSLAQMAPTLERLKFLAKEQGFTIDDTTQKMIDQATAAGLMKKDEISLADTMLAGFGELIKALGKDVPAAMQAAMDKMSSGFNTITDAVDGAKEAIHGSGLYSALEDVAKIAPPSLMTITDGAKLAEDSQRKLADAVGLVGLATVGMNDTAKAAYDKMVQEAENSFAKTGNALTPITDGFADFVNNGLNPITDGFGLLDSGAKTALGTIGDLSNGLNGLDGAKATVHVTSDGTDGGAAVSPGRAADTRKKDEDLQRKLQTDSQAAMIQKMNDLIAAVKEGKVIEMEPLKIEDTISTKTYKYVQKQYESGNWPAPGQ